MRCPLVEDPRARTSFTYGAAYALAQQGHYRARGYWLTRMWTDVEKFDLEFARPLGLWTRRLIRLGMRRFGEAERLLQTLEDSAAAHADERHALNARILRARLLLQTGKHAEAVKLTLGMSRHESTRHGKGNISRLGPWHSRPAAISQTPSWHAAQALAVSGMVEVRMLVAAARAIAHAGEDSAPERTFGRSNPPGRLGPGGLRISRLRGACRRGREQRRVAGSDRTDVRRVK